MKNNNILILFLDIFFVLFLCFVLLIFTMILNKDGGMPSGSVYVIDWVRLATVIISVFVYLYFITRTSMRELSNILSTRAAILSSEHNAEENGTE